MADITMPQLGETVTEGTITKWFKAVGDTVAEDEPLFEVSTDKVDSEVPSPLSGTLTEIRVPEGETVDVGVVLAVVGEASGAPAAPSEASSESVEAPANAPVPPASPGPAIPADAPAAVARWATQRLRPQAFRVFEETTPLGAWPDVESRSIVCRADRAINPVWVRAAARERLGVEPIELDGGHAPFLTRPADLARILDSMV